MSQTPRPPSTLRRLLRAFAFVVVGLLSVVVVGLAVGNALGVPLARGLVRFPAMMARFTSKTVCSCAFVSDRSDEQCHDMAKQNPDIASFVVDKTAKTVTASALGASKTARYLGPSKGCVVDE